MQLIISEERQEIIATFFGTGKTHDYKLYQMSRVKPGKQIRLKGDLGCWGLQTQCLNVILPLKNSKPHQLSKAEKKVNREWQQSA